jgi:hypothetical protein
MLERGRGREHDDLVGTAVGPELGVELAQAVAPFPAADERERSDGARSAHARAR